MVLAAARKGWNWLSWEVHSRLTKWSADARFQLLQFLLRRNAPWPTIMPPLTFRQIYQRAEAAYAPKVLTGPEIMLVRAKAGEAGDTPYIELYTDNTLGWNGLVPHLRISDVDGGHYSMLQEPFAEELALTIRDVLPQSAPSQIHAAEVQT